MCAGCHVTMGPRDCSFFRDWYAGRKFGEYAVKTGEAPRLIAAHETVLERDAEEPRVAVEPGVPVRGDRRDEEGPGVLWAMRDSGARASDERPT